MKIKAMKEKRASFYNQAQEIFNAAAEEGRDLTPEEEAKFADCCDKVERYDKMIARAKAIKLESEHQVDDIDDLLVDDFAGATDESVRNAKQFAADVRSMAGYIRAMVAGVDYVDANMTTNDNGAVIPNTILKKIVEKVADITPLYRFANRYIYRGTLSIPKEDESVDSITVALATEFQDLVPHASKLTSVSLNPQLYGSLVKVSKKLINSTDFDLIGWLINKLAYKQALWIDDTILNGRKDGSNNVIIPGIANSYDSDNMTVTLANKDKVTVDELIDLQELIPDSQQEGAFFIMNRETRKAIRKLKDGEGRYLLVTDNNARFGKRLLEADVYTTSALSALGTNSKNVIIYVNPAGVAIQEMPDKEIDVLREKFVTQHAVGVVLWSEIDCAVENTQMVAVAVTPAA